MSRQQPRQPERKRRPCGKRMLSKGKAEGVVQAARRSGLGHRLEQRVYFCIDCGAWHTTRREYQTFDERIANATHGKPENAQTLRRRTGEEEDSRRSEEDPGQEAGPA